MTDTKTTPGSLIIVSAPSGAGKTSLVNAIVDMNDNITQSISHTTRSQRPGEQHGIHYFFTDPDTFQSMVKQQRFLEHAEVFGHFYGTDIEQIQEKIMLGQHVILEIDWQGARQVRAQLPSSLSIFILPPSKESLRKRLLNRQQDRPEVIEKRLEKAVNEMSHFNEFDYLIINDNFDKAKDEFQAIITNLSLKQSLQKEKYAELIKQLLYSDTSSG